MNSRYGSDGVQSGTLTKAWIAFNHGMDGKLRQGYLFVLNSRGAFESVERICEALVRLLPPPVRKIVVDLSATEKVLVGPDIEPRP